MECVGCGFCCIKSPCGLELMVHGHSLQCPELVWNKEKNRYFCNFVLKKEIDITPLYIGEGCCCGLNSWRKDIKERRKIDE